MDKKVYSLDGQIYFDSIEEIEEIFEGDIGEICIVVADKITHKASYFYRNDTVANLIEDAYDEDIISWEIDDKHGAELENEIKQLIDAWADRTNNHPNFFTVDNIEQKMYFFDGENLKEVTIDD